MACLKCYRLCKGFFKEHNWTRRVSRQKEILKEINGKSTKGNYYNANYSNKKEKTVGRFAICYRGCDVKWRETHSIQVTTPYAFPLVKNNGGRKYCKIYSDKKLTVFSLPWTRYLRKHLSTPSHLPELINRNSQRFCIPCRCCLLFFFGNNAFLLVFLLGENILVGTHNVNGRFLMRRMRENWKRKKWDGQSVTVSCDNRNAANEDKHRYVLDYTMRSAPFFFLFLRACFNSSSTKAWKISFAIWFFIFFYLFQSRDKRSYWGHKMKCFARRLRSPRDISLQQNGRQEQKICKEDSHGYTHQRLKKKNNKN